MPTPPKEAPAARSRRGRREPPADADEQKVVEYAAGGIRFNGCGSGEKRNWVFECTQHAKRKAEQGGVAVVVVQSDL